jgi:hypothetical protein
MPLQSVIEQELGGVVMKKKVLVFCFTVSVTVSLIAQDIFNNEVQKAVNSLSASLQVRSDVIVNDITLNGTQDMTAEVSRYLKDKIEEHALKNPKFNVLKSRGRRLPVESSIGIISGTYSIKGNNVEGYLELSRGNRLLRKETIIIPVSEFNNISLLPANFKTQEEAKKQDEAIAVIIGTANRITQENTAQGINIQAWFDSYFGSRLYMHREPLDLTIMADRDCYFKVYIINANNQKRLFYPNERDTDNRLFANRPRTIFENAKYYCYKPYGAETIWIVASADRFEDIEREYVMPWTAVTVEPSRTVVRGGSRGDSVLSTSSQSVSGEFSTRYTINVLPPDQEYNFDRPKNMTEVVEDMRNETRKQNGTFDDKSNQTSGYSILENIRISYNISRETPEIIMFAYYNLNGLPGGRGDREQTRGPDFTFEINKPRDITQAIQKVRDEIEKADGVFNGDEERGTFEVKKEGIKGEYRVAEKVYITITEKPVIIPNFLIKLMLRKNKVLGVFP